MSVEKDERLDKKQWKREISAGGIVYKKHPPATQAGERAGGDKILILLIKPSGKTHDSERKWTFPKGWMDAGEKPEETAVREVKEEAGIEAKIIEKLGSIKYTFKWEGENIFKIVAYYLMEYISGDPKDHDFEVAEAGWFALVDAEKMLSYKTDKEIFEKAKSKLRA